jgi:tetratricopeptide (TPR) repeat protein
LKGELLLARGRFDEAIVFARDSLKIWVPKMTLGQIRISQNYPVEQDILARAYLAKGDLERAAIEYERLVYFDPESNDRRMRNPRYRYRLGKVYEDMKRRGDAIEQYQSFLEVWKNADRNLPEYIDARRRLDALTGR